jgi:hypothetical protein
MRLWVVKKTAGLQPGMVIVSPIPVIIIFGRLEKKDIQINHDEEIIFTHFTTYFNFFGNCTIQ